MVARLWLVFACAGVGFGALTVTTVPDEAAVEHILNLMGWVTSAAIAAGLILHRPRRPLAWYCILGCAVLQTVGFGVLPRWPALAGVGVGFTAIGYLLGFCGLVLLVRGRIPGGDRAAVLDATIVAAGVGVLVWAFGFAPIVAARHESALVSAAVFYPVLIASGAVVRMWFLPGRHRPATRLIVVLVLASNLISIVGILRELAPGGGFGPLYHFTEFVAATLAGATALHPAMAYRVERQAVAVTTTSRRRIVALTFALLINPATLAIEFLRGGSVDPVPYVIGGGLLSVLVVARLGEVLGQLGQSIRDRDMLAERLRSQTLHDPLTGLPNRTLFGQRLALAFAGRTTELPPAIVLIDLDDFKAVNDTYGHDTGDALLIAVGQRLRWSIRPEDVAARLGGDEFVILLPTCAGEAGAAALAARVLAALREPFELAGQVIEVQASAGAALGTIDCPDGETLVRNADLAMYLAKGRGKGRFEAFHPALNLGVRHFQRRVDLERGILAGDLRLHFQPIVELPGGRTRGYEALVRWSREGRLVAPAEFIPLAEATGLIDPLTDWVIDTACQAVAVLEQLDPQDESGEASLPWISVNVSGRQLLRTDFVTRVGEALRASGLRADRLVVEITENSLLEVDNARPTLNALRSLGVRIAIDDFGIGYSALSYLAKLAVDMVKVDRSFVAALDADGPEEAITRAIVDLCARLDVTTIGEGIENERQLHRLIEIGCELGQGYYFARPASLERLTADAVQLPRSA